MGAMADATYEVVGVTPATSEAFLEVETVTWFDEPDPTDTDPLGSLDLDRCYAATRTGAPPFSGVYGWLDLLLTVPAPGDGGLRQVPCAGLTWVGVHPDDRRTGVLRTMVGHHLDDLHARGVAVAALHASEVGIYGRFGYATASVGVRLTASRGADVTAPGVDDADVRTRFVRADEPGVADRLVALHAAEAAASLGQVRLPEAPLRRRLRTSPSELRGSEPTRVLLAERGGTDVGYAVLRRTPHWQDGSPAGRVRCWDLTTIESGARLALLRRLLAFDLTGPVELPARSLEDPVLWWLGGPRAGRARVDDALWVRLVDVPGALEQRGWATDADLRVEVTDDRCPWNARTWRLTVVDGGATCVPDAGPADLTLPVQALGAAYLGGRSIRSQAEQGLVAEHNRGAVDALSRAMATTGSPVGAIGF